MASTSRVDSVITTNIEQPKVATPPKLEIEKGEGFFYFYVCGAPGVGKTALITRYCQNHFPKWYDPPDLNNHKVENFSQHQCLFEFVELEGTDVLDHRLHACPPGLQALDILLLLYDIGDRSTFSVLPKIYQTILELTGKVNVPVAVVANKVDMFQESREVDAEEGMEFAESIGGISGQCTAREGDGVKEIIQQLMKLAVKARLHTLAKQDMQLLRQREIRKEKQEQSKKSKRENVKRSISERIKSRLSFSSS